MTRLAVSEKELTQDPSQDRFIFNETQTTSLSAATKNIILFGETGAGKSSIINLMAGRNVAPTSPNLEGCTLQAVQYSFTLSNPELSFRVFDTVGLGEPDLSITRFFSAVEKAQTLIKTLNEAGGIDLLLFCVSAGRQTVAMQRTYRLFAEILCGNRVPLATVITHLENEDVMDDWWKRNEKTFEKYGISAVAHACITSLPAHVTLYAEKREQSQKALQELFRGALGDSKPYTRNVREWLTIFIEKFRSLLTNRAIFKRRVIVSALEERCGFSRDEAQRLANIIVSKR